MTTTPAHALLLLSVFVSLGFALRVADASALDKRDEGPRALAALEKLREQALNEVALSLELVDIGQESDDEPSADILEKHNETLRELEREFSQRRGELFGGGRPSEGRGREGRGNRQSEVVRELAQLEAERERELRHVDEELERELRTAQAEASGEQEPEQYDEKARSLRAKHFEKVSRIERRFAEKRGHILRKVK